MACTGDIENLDTYYKMTGSLDVTYRKFLKDHSLIMGAYRNSQWDTVLWLLDHGAKLTYEEQQEINEQYMEHMLLWKLQNVVPGSKEP